MTMYGADIAALRSLAAQLDRAADQLDAHRTFLGNVVQQSPWHGPDADRFRGEWQGQHSPRVATSARLLRETAATVRQNADQQERASAVDGGAPGLRSGVEGGISSERFANALDGSLFTVDLAKVLDEVSSFSPGDAVSSLARVLGTDADKVLAKMQELKVANAAGVLSKGLGSLGVASDAVSMVQDFASGHYIDGTLGTAVTGTSAASLAGEFGLGGPALATVAPLAAGVAAFKGFVDITIPTTPEHQADMYRVGAESLFGPNVDINNLSSEQAQAMGDHYSGAMGVVNMISDTMDASAKRIFPWNW
jgi:uncharacterized protein YukE